MNRVGRNVGMLLVIATMAVTTFAGEIQVAWDATPGATGYKVYYGTSSGGYGTPVVVYGTSATIQGLQDCVSYFVAVKAFNSAGDSPNYSNELSGWSRPSITSATPPAAMQGDQIVIDVMGANFRNGAAVDLGNPHVVLTGVTVISCNHIQLLATVEPTAATIRPAQIGRLDLTVSNPDSVFGTKPQAFEVLINPARFDVNQSDATTTNRIDGKDTIYISRQFGTNEANPNYDADDDFDGDGWVDGQDLAYIASNLGRCWSAASQSWTLAACPTAMQ
jgi:uncharacterized Zn-binding protein involved in type VI secretion